MKFINDITVLTPGHAAHFACWLSTHPVTIAVGAGALAPALVERLEEYGQASNAGFEYNSYWIEHVAATEEGQADSMISKAFAEVLRLCCAPIPGTITEFRRALRHYLDVTAGPGDMAQDELERYAAVNENPIWWHTLARASKFAGTMAGGSDVDRLTHLENAEKLSRIAGQLDALKTPPDADELELARMEGEGGIARDRDVETEWGQRDVRTDVSSEAYPTVQLRYRETEEQGGVLYRGKPAKYRILQQLWLSPDGQVGEWRDVPVVGVDVLDVIALGRFDHHPDPATDFCVEVEAIEGELRNLQLGLDHAPKPADLLRRINLALEFKTGGDEGAVKAKGALREIWLVVSALSAGTIPKPDPLKDALQKAMI